ncbi:MAG: MFS transporter [Thermoanaerobaculia bacterium]
MQARDFIQRLGVLMATVFIDMIGFLIVLPLLPFYAEKLGATPFVVGALISSFAVAQLASAPIWGRLSDKYGRRPMILSGLLISAVAYVLFESADSTWLLFLSRFVQGFGGGTVGVVQAYLSDSVAKQDRAKAFGWLTAATSAGVMVGPAIGSLAASYGTIGPGYLAAIFCVVNFAFAFFWLKETAPTRTARPGRSGEEVPSTPRGSIRRAIGEILRHPRSLVAKLVWIYSLGMMAFMAMNGVLALFLERQFGVNEATIGWFFVYVGGVSLLMRSLILGPAVRRFGEVPVMRAGAISIGLGLVTLPLARNFWELGAAVLLIPIGTALLFPTTTSLVSHCAPEEQTGLTLGVQQAFGGVARMLGPLWAGAVFQYFGVAMPFWLAAGFMVGAWLVASSVKIEDDAPTTHVEPLLPGETP